MVKWSEIRGELPKVHEILNEQIEIKKVYRIQENNEDEIVAVLSDGREFSTNSKELGQQLAQVKGYIDETDETVIARIIAREDEKGKVYFKLV